MKARKRPRVRFRRCREPEVGGPAEWEVLLDGVEVGSIEKGVVWHGAGYVADSYFVTVHGILNEEGDDEEPEECFRVKNIWNKDATLTARQALAAAKEFARRHLVGEGKQ